MASFSGVNDGSVFNTILQVRDMNVADKHVMNRGGVGPCSFITGNRRRIRIGQQKRKAFGFSWQTKVGTDEDADKGYIIHVVWNATAQPSEKSHETMNDSPDAETFSWECDTVPVNVTGYKDVAVMEFDSTVLTAAQMKAVEDLLYGTDSEDAKLPTPDELIAAVKAAV